ncbi:MAG: hypothetical protein RLZZ626_454, partial [Actinomycetota bacterium]
MTNTWVILPAVEGDLDEIMALENASFATDAWSVDNMHAELEVAHTAYFVVREDERLIGYGGVSVIPGTGQGDIQTIAIDEFERGRGVGRSLMGALMREAATQGAREMFLEVRADNPSAIGLYRSLGFEQIDSRKRYYMPDGVDALVMRANLEPLRTQDLEPLVLGIETSCDETGIGIVRGNRLLANVISSSMDEHARFGGVVPEIAARAHLEALRPTLHEALNQAGVTLDELDAIAVTNGPGLAGALMVGVGAAKALAVATGKPIYAVNHLVGHVGVDILE